MEEGSEKPPFLRFFMELLPDFETRMLKFQWFVEFEEITETLVFLDKYRCSIL